MTIQAGRALGVALMLAAGACAAQTLSSRPMRLLMPCPPGGANDTNARTVGAKLTDQLKLQVIIDNRSGANGMVATTLLAKSAPDGHTLMAVDVAHAANPALYDNLPYDTIRDFSSIGMVARVPMMLLVHPAQPFKTVKELVAYAKANAGRLNLWRSLIVPAATPRAVIVQLNSELNRALASADVKERLMQAGNEIISGTPAQGNDFIRADVEHWKKIVGLHGIEWVN